MKTIIIAIYAIALVSLAITPNTAYAQRGANPDPAEQQTRRAQAVSRTVFEALEKARLLVEAEDYDAAIVQLNALIDKDSLSEYELANVFQHLGFCYHSKDDTPAAIATFSKILDIESVELQMRKRTLFTLAQLHSVVERYDHALVALESWFELEPNPAPSAYFFNAQILYQLDRHKAMIAPIESALTVATEQGKEPKEEWYSLLSFAYFQEQDFAKIVDINKLLLQKWPKKKYWLYLANAYRELEDDASLVIAYDCAYVSGLLDSESELITLAQLLLQNDTPFKAAKLLQAEMANGRIEKNAKNYRLLSQAWLMALEDERSIEPLEIAANMEASGDLQIRLANALLNLGQHDQCAAAAREGIRKGDLKSPDYAQMTLGMCLYKSHEYRGALTAFHKAAQTSRSTSAANEWLRITRLDIKRDEEIATVEARALEHIRAIAERRNRT